MGLAAIVCRNINFYKDYPSSHEFDVEKETGCVQCKSGGMSVSSITGIDEESISVQFGNSYYTGTAREYLKRYIGVESTLFRFMNQNIGVIKVEMLDDLDVEIKRLYSMSIEFDEEEERVVFQGFMFQFQKLLEFARYENNPILLC